jgi:GTP-binding protein
MDKPHASRQGKEIKINYITQVKTTPPMFAFFTNEPKLIEDRYRRFLERLLREKFGFVGVPILLTFKKKNR